MQIDISLRSGLFGMASKCSEMWFRDDMLSHRDDDAFQVTVAAADFAEEDMRERFISLAGNTPGLMNLIAEAVSCQVSNLMTAGISVTIRRDDAARSGYADPFDNAYKMRDLLTGPDAVACWLDSPQLL